MRVAEPDPLASSHARLSPSGRTSGSLPAQASSMSDPYWSRRGPLTVPEANRSPVRSDAPLAVMCASICAGLQCMAAYGGRDTTCPLMRTSSWMSSPQSPESAR